MAKRKMTKTKAKPKKLKEVLKDVTLPHGGLAGTVYPNLSPMKQVASVAVRYKGQLLFLTRADNGRSTLPGGHLNPNEDPVDGALRELEEETGIKPKKEDIIPLGTGQTSGYLVHSFLYEPEKLPKMDFSLDPDGEAKDHFWADDLLTNPHVPNDKNVTLHLLNYCGLKESSNLTLNPAPTKDLQKNIKGALAGLTLSLASLPWVSHGQSQDQSNIPTHVEPSPSNEWSTEGLHHDLIGIAHLESNFNQNTNHTKNPKGDFETAYGPLGMKPSTAYEEYTKSDKLKSLFPGLEDKTQFTEKFKNDWKFHNLTASSHWLRLKYRHKSNEAAAYAWRFGSTAAQTAAPELINETPYVQKYQALSQNAGVKR